MENRCLEKTDIFITDFWDTAWRSRPRFGLSSAPWPLAYSVCLTNRVDMLARRWADCFAAWRKFEWRKEREVFYLSTLSIANDIECRWKMVKLWIWSKAGWYRRGKTEVPEENVYQCRTDHHKFHIVLPRIESGPTWWPPELPPGLEVQRSQMSSHECAVTKGRQRLLSHGFKAAARDHICKLYVCKCVL